MNTGYTLLTSHTFACPSGGFELLLRGESEVYFRLQ